MWTPEATYQFIEKLVGLLFFVVIFLWCVGVFDRD